MGCHSACCCVEPCESRLIKIELLCNLCLLLYEEPVMENKDLLGIGQAFGQSIPVKKLLSILEKFGGRAFKPLNDLVDANTEAYKIKKLADAKAYEVVTLEKANTSALVNRTEAELHLLQKASIRLVQQEIKRQENIDAISQIAFDEIQDEAQVSEEPVNNDWTTRFFSIAQDVSDEEMRQMWGRILAGEIKQPNSYSLRTLDLLKNISKSEADIFLKFVKHSVRVTNGQIVIINNSELVEKSGIEFVDKLLMEEIGLIASKDNLSYSIGLGSETVKFAVVQGSKGFLVELDGINNPVKLEVLTFTKPGLELLSLVKVEADDIYLKEIGKLIKAGIEGRKVKFGPYIEHDDQLKFIALEDII